MSPDIGPNSISRQEGGPVSDPGPQRLSWLPDWVPNWRTLVSVALGVAYPFLVYWVSQPGFGLLLFLPPVGVNLGLAWFFGRTLAPGREALITRFARLEHGQPDPRLLAYTHRLTWVWTVFFLVMAMVSVALAASGVREAWVWFTAVGNYLCVAALFAIEHAYRRWRFPHNDSVSPWQQILMMRAALWNRRR